MDFQHFSLIYPTYEDKLAHADGKNVPDIDMFTLQELGLLECFNLRGKNLSDFFTTDPTVITYRQSVFDDMMRCPEIGEMFERLVPILNDVLELRRLEVENDVGEDYLSCITEIELYVESVRVLHEGMVAVSGKVKSDAFIRLKERVTELAESDYYKNLNVKLNELTDRVREIRSVTVGVNLDNRLRPASAGVLSVNASPFKSGDTLEKILHLDFKNDEYTCIADLVPFNKRQNENQKLALSQAFNGAISEVYKSSLKGWKRIVQDYVLENTEFLLDLMPEFEFLVKGTAMLLALKNKGCPLAIPDIRPMEEKAFKAVGLYNPCVAMKISDDVVPNDLIFDEKATIYVLSGPNRGGKSVITCALGLAQVMLQLGMFIPAESAVLSPVDGIYTHFPTGADDTIDKGRLGEECARLSEIIDSVTPYSLVLLDESLSSTGSYEASYIAAEVLGGLSHMQCRCLFSTHLHELTAEIDRLNARSLAAGDAPIDTLVAGMETEGKRSFKIIRKKPDGKSYAKDIADSYGLSYEKILEKFEST